MVLPYSQFHIHRSNQLWIMLYCSIYYWKKSTCKWAHTVQTLVVQVPTVFCCWWNVLHMSVKFISTMVFFKSTITLLIFWCSLLKNDVFKSPTILCYYFFLQFFKVCFIYSGALMLGAYVSITVIYFWLIDLFIIICLYIIPFLSLVTVFVLKSILSDVTIASSLCLPFTWDIFFPPFTFSLCVILKTKMSLL